MIRWDPKRGKANYALTKYVSAAVVFQFFTWIAYSQSEIPLGTWRAHISYNSIHSIALSNEKVFGAAQNGIVVLDRRDNSLQTYTKLSGLNGAPITAINFDEEREQLLVSYKDGKIDLIRTTAITSADPTRNSNLTGSKKINHISVYQNLAYLSADFGVVIFDLNKAQVKETWRDIGSNGATLKIFESTFKGDSIFLATDKGVLAGDLRTNLLDFKFWKRFTTAEFSDSIASIATFNNKIYAAVSREGLFRYEGSRWIKESFLQNISFKSLNASPTDLFVSGDKKLWRLSDTNSLTQIEDAAIGDPNTVAVQNAELWIADDKNGIVSNHGGPFERYTPNGPSISTGFKLFFRDNVLHSVAGGYTSAYAPAGNPGIIDRFYDGSWSTQESLMADLTDVAFDTDNGLYYLSSFGYGIEQRNQSETVKLFNESNSPLVNTNFPSRSVLISAIEKGPSGLWVANYDATVPLHFLGDEEAWQSFSFPVAAARYPLELAVDFSSNVWAILNPSKGGGVVVFNPEKNVHRYLTSVDGSGGLPNKAVRSVALDREGMVWLGTDEGVCYFTDTDEVLNPGAEAIKPIFEDRFLLRDDKVTAIAVDGGNRKWLGTERGAWLFSPTGDKLFYNFTAENSPLLSNIIHDIKINPETGEVFFATDQGLVSFRADATESNAQFHTLKLVPNPVTPNFHGTVGINGLATDAIVKIADIAGKLVWEGRAHGGTASWNMRDYNGKRVETGIYLVVSVSATGTESRIGKLAVIE